MKSNPYILAARLGLEVFKIVKESMKKTDPEKRRKAMIEFDEALKKTKEEGSTKEIEIWLSKNL